MLLWMLTWAFFFYHGVTFILLLAHPCFVAWSSVYYIGHVLPVVTIALSLVLPKARRKTSAVKHQKGKPETEKTDAAKKTD